MSLFILLACNNGYNLNQIPDKIVEEDQDTAVTEPWTGETAEEDVSEGDTGSAEIETGGEPDYCTPFDDFNDWNYFGDGNWHIENNLLYENQGGYYATAAYLYDFGNSAGFSMEVTATWEGDLNDLSGFVFNLDPQAGTYWTATIDDPQNSYGRYSPAGAVLISQCIEQDCLVMAQDSSLEMLSPSGSAPVHLRLVVIGEQVEVYWENTLAFSQTISGINGPGTVGLYSNDNDGGVIYDDFCVDVYQKSHYS